MVRKSGVGYCVNDLHRSEMRELPGCVWPSQGLWFKEGGTWTAVSSGNLGIRFFPSGCLFDAGGQVVVGEKCKEAIGFLNSSFAKAIADLLMPTLNYKCGIMKTLPDFLNSAEGALAETDECITLSKADYDSFETSLDFNRHPLL